MLVPAQEHRRALGAFLRSRRGAVTAAEVGIPSGTRRRTPGLRREEVAALSGISPTWIAWLEQGRDVSVSALALARLATTLRLSPVERGYLFELAQRRDPVAPAATMPEVPNEFAALLASIAAPAYVLDRCWQVRAWNPAAERLFAPWLSSDEPSLLRWVFLDPVARTFICDWATRARRLVAEFRVDVARHAADPELASVVRNLQWESADFARCWTMQAVAGREGGTRTFDHSQDGRVVMRQVTLTAAILPDHKIVVLLPA